VRRVLPDSLVVSVESRRPKARVVGAGASWVIDAESVVLDTWDRTHGRLPEIRIVDGGVLHSAPGNRLVADARFGGVIAQALSVIDWMARDSGSVPTTVNYLRVDEQGIVLVTARLEIIVGDGSDMDGKMAAVRSLLRANPPAEPSTIDARYRDMLVVTALPRETE
jgi:hypothetical protein